MPEQKQNRKRTRRGRGRRNFRLPGSLNLSQMREAFAASAPATATATQPAPLAVVELSSPIERDPLATQLIPSTENRLQDIALLRGQSWKDEKKLPAVDLSLHHLAVTKKG